MNFQQKLARYVLGYSSNSDLIDIAETGLEEGFKSTSLAIVAGLSEKENSFVFNEYFQKALKELDIQLPSKDGAFKILVSYFADKIIKKEIDVYKSVREIYHFLSSGISSADYDLFVYHYYKIDDLYDRQIKFDDEKMREKLIEESEREFIADLINWKEKYKI